MSKKSDKKVDNIFVGPFKAVKYFEAQIEGPDKWMKKFVDIGRQVITEEQYRNIGFNYVLNNAIKNKFKLESVKKPKIKK